MIISRRLTGVFLLIAVLGVLATSAAALGGMVVDAEGEALPNLNVILKAEEHRYKTITDEDGVFRFYVPIEDDAILLLDGADSMGRVLITADKASEPLVLTYPVITEVVLLHDNDQHFDFNFVDAVEAEIERIRREHINVFHFNAGDIFVRHPDRWGESGNLDWYADQAQSIIEIMNRLGYDAMTLGNHELDAHDMVTRQALELADFPLLTANADITTDKLPDVKPYAIFETDEGYTIAVLGLSIGSFDGVTCRNPIETTREYRDLADEYDVFIALTHIGVATDIELAAEAPELDVIIGGHSHTLLEEPVEVNGVLVAQAGGGGHTPDPEKSMYLGTIILTLENGVPVEKTGWVRAFTVE